jgi:hypothetical protein
MNAIADRISRECRSARGRKIKPASPEALKSMTDQIGAMVAAGRVTKCPTAFAAKTLQVDL